MASDWLETPLCHGLGGLGRGVAKATFLSLHPFVLCRLLFEGCSNEQHYLFSLDSEIFWQLILVIHLVSTSFACLVFESSAGEIHGMFVKVVDHGVIANIQLVGAVISPVNKVSGCCRSRFFKEINL